MLRVLDFGKYKNIPVYIIPFEYLYKLYHFNKRFKQKEYNYIRQMIEKQYKNILFNSYIKQWIK